MSDLPPMSKVIAEIHADDKPALTLSELTTILEIDNDCLDDLKTQLNTNPRIECGEIAGAKSYWLASNGRRKVTIEEMVQAIENAEKPYTKQDIADFTGVSRSTISNYSDELEADSRIRHAKVGTAEVYWLAGRFENSQ